jgi:tRNA nucleotidyltransferase/poly(A) polymerase
MHSRHNASDISVYLDVLTKAGAELFEVGGPVRDRIMGSASKDHDMLCRHLPLRKVAALLAPYGKVATVGKSFGVVKFTPRGASHIEMDIALPRRERSTGTGHRDFEVDSDPEISVEDDLGRRDFTINAMAMSLTSGEIIDPHGGRADLDRHILRMVFPRAFDEDPLRLMRAVQFAARFGFTIEDNTWQAMKRSAALIETVSGERIGMELRKLMMAPKPSVGFDLMHDCGLLPFIMPELTALKGVEQDKQPGDDVYAHTMRALDAARADATMEHPGDMEVMFAVLFHDLGKVKTARYHPPSRRVVFFGHQIVSARLARKIIGRLKLTTIGIKQADVSRLIEQHMFETKASFTDRAIRRFVAKVGKDLISKLMDVRLADNRGGKHPHGIKGVLRLRKRIHEELAKKPPFGPADLAVGGHDLMELGIPEGPALGAMLGMMVECVLDEPERNTREQLLALAREIMENPDRIQAAVASRSIRRRPSDDEDTGADDAEEDRSPESGKVPPQGR